MFDIIYFFVYTTISGSIFIFFRLHKLSFGLKRFLQTIWSRNTISERRLLQRTVKFETILLKCLFLYCNDIFTYVLLCDFLVRPNFGWFLVETAPREHFIYFTIVFCKKNSKLRKIWLPLASNFTMIITITIEINTTVCNYFLKNK